MAGCIFVVSKEDDLHGKKEDLLSSQQEGRHCRSSDKGGIYKNSQTSTPQHIKEGNGKYIHTCMITLVQLTSLAHA